MNGMLANQKVLIIDDELSVCELLHEEFQYHQAKSEYLQSFIDANRRMRLQKFDMIIADVGRDAEELSDFLKVIRTVYPENPPITLLMTGYPDSPMDSYYELGAEAILAKPFTLKGMVETIGMILSSPRDQWRKNKRPTLALNIEVKWPELDHWLMTRTINISETGLYVALMDDLPPKLGVTIDFRLLLPEVLTQQPSSPGLENYPSVIFGKSVVKWLRKEASDSSPRGMGVEFFDLNEPDILVIKNLVENLKKTLPS